VTSKGETLRGGVSAGGEEGNLGGEEVAGVVGGGTAKIWKDWEGDIGEGGPQSKKPGLS